MWTPTVFECRAPSLFSLCVLLSRVYASSDINHNTRPRSWTSFLSRLAWILLAHQGPYPFSQVTGIMDFETHQLPHPLAFMSFVLLSPCPDRFPTPNTPSPPPFSSPLTPMPGREEAVWTQPHAQGCCEPRAHTGRVSEGADQAAVQDHNQQLGHGVL